MGSFIELVVDEGRAKFSPDDHVTVTGPFDGWGHEQYVMAYDGAAGVYRVGVPHGGEEELVFKFVVNGTAWVTVDCFEQVVDGQGHCNNRVRCADWLPRDGGARTAKGGDDAGKAAGAGGERESEIIMHDVVIESAAPPAPGAPDKAGGSSVAGSTDEQELEQEVGAYSWARSAGCGSARSSSGSVQSVQSVQSVPTAAGCCGGVAAAGQAGSALSDGLGKRTALPLPGDYFHVVSRGDLNVSDADELSPTITEEEEQSARYYREPEDTHARFPGIFSALQMLKTYWRG